MASTIKADIIANAASATNNLTLGATGGVTVGGDLSVGGNYNISGTLTLGTPLTVGNGGTGLTSLATSCIPYGNGTSAFSSSASLTYNGTTVSCLLNSSSTNTAFYGNQNLALQLGNTSNTAGNGAYIANSFYNGGINAYIGFLNVDQNYASAITFGTSVSGASNYGERMRIDSAGNLGLGVTPSAWNGMGAVQINPGGAFVTSSSYARFGANFYYDGSYRYINASSMEAARYEQAAGAHVWYTAGAGTAGSAISFTQAMTLDASSNLSVKNYYRFLDNASNPTDSTASFYNQAYVGPTLSGNAIEFRTGSTPTPAGRFDSSGNLLVGTTNASTTAGSGVKIVPSATTPYVSTVGSSTSGSDAAYILYSTGAANYIFYVGYNGTISATSTTISAISDRRLKENIVDLDVGLDALLTLKPRKFDWKTGKGKNIKGDRGWIADEFQQVFPDLIDTWKDEPPEGEEPYKAVRPDLIPVIIKAIQELAAKVSALEARI